MHIKQFFVFSLISVHLSYSAVTLTKNQLSYQVSDNHAFDPHNYISIRFSITNPTNKIIYALPIASFDGYIAQKPDLNSFYNVLPSENLMYDIEALWNGKAQHYINIKPKYNTTVYVTVFNLDPDDRRFDITFNLNINWGQSSLTCPTCPGVAKSLDYCSCKNCPQINTFGYDCGSQITTINSENSNYQYVLSNDELLHILIPLQSDQYLILSISAALPMECYIKYQNQQGQVAGYANHQPSGFIQFKNNGLSKSVVVQNSNSQSVLVTVGFYNIGINVFSISYRYQNKFSIVYIILIVLGVTLCFLFVVLIVFLVWFFKCRKKVVSQNTSKIKKVDNKLTNQQIDRYFPQFIPTQLNKREQQTMHYLRQKQDNDLIFEQDCVICLCAIENNAPARITYCKHIFHSKCLINWFKKQRNCPYCRQQFGRIETSFLLQKLNEQSQRQLSGISLVKTIYTGQGNFYIKQVDPIKIQIQNTNNSQEVL